MIDNVVKDILKKKELAHIDKAIAAKTAESMLDSKTRKIIAENRFKSGTYKEFIKKVRAVLRKQYGAFQNPKIDRKEMLKRKDWKGLLNSHKSSKERLPYYADVYEKIFSITGKPSSILDIGCGMNPISYEYMKLGNVEYWALDISREDLEIIKTYFEEKRIKWETRLFDATKDIYNFNKTFDAAFMFKLLEILETTKSHRLTEEIVRSAPAKWIIASFSTKTLSGKSMTSRRRVWFEVMLERIGYYFETFETPNEIFYIIRKA